MMNYLTPIYGYKKLTFRILCDRMLKRDDLVELRDEGKSDELRFMILLAEGRPGTNKAYKVFTTP